MVSVCVPFCKNSEWRAQLDDDNLGVRIYIALTLTEYN